MWRRANRVPHFTLTIVLLWAPAEHFPEVGKTCSLNSSLIFRRLLLLRHFPTFPVYPIPPLFISGDNILLKYADDIILLAPEHFTVDIAISYSSLGSSQQTLNTKTRKPCCRKETARCRSCSFQFKVRR